MLSQKQSENHKLKEKVHLARHPEPLTINFNLPFSLFCSLWPIFSLMSILFRSSVVWVKMNPPPHCKDGCDDFKLSQILTDFHIKRWALALTNIIWQKLCCTGLKFGCEGSLSLYSHLQEVLCAWENVQAGWVERTHRRELRQPRQLGDMGPKPSRTVWPWAVLPNDPKCMSEPGQYTWKRLSHPTWVLPKYLTHRLMN